jgi:tetratricopeptide (TPR) repeat protein
LLLSILALHEDLSHKEIEARAGLSPRGLSQILRRTQIKEGMFERLLAAIGSRPDVVRIVTACVEALEGLEAAADLSPRDREAIEDAVLAAARVAREDLTAALHHARTLPFEGYPKPADLAPARIRAGRQWERLKDLPEETALAVVRVAEEFQSWALCERVCEESVRETSRSLQRAASLARLAVETAEQVKGPEGWRKRVCGYARAHGPNVLRVAGELQLAEAGLEEAKRLWLAGTDPGGVLDPGRLLDLEAALRRGQRRFTEALSLLDQAVKVSSFPERGLINKGFTLEVMGEYELAIETLERVAPMINQRAQPRLWNIVRLNLANNLCHLGRSRDAAVLIEAVRPQLLASGDKLDLIRVQGLEGRILAGLGRIGEARRLLGEARRRFAAEAMHYDVALVLLEEAVLLLKEGSTDQVKVLVREFLDVFKSKGVHREALAALRLFQEAVERETATIEFAHRVLRYLLRARYDQGLQFTSC